MEPAPNFTNRQHQAYKAPPTSRNDRTLQDPKDRPPIDLRVWDIQHNKFTNPPFNFFPQDPVRAELPRWDPLAFARHSPPPQWENYYEPRDSPAFKTWVAGELEEDLCGEVVGTSRSLRESGFNGEYYNRERARVMASSRTQQVETRKQFEYEVNEEVDFEKNRHGKWEGGTPERKKKKRYVSDFYKAEVLPPPES